MRLSVAFILLLLLPSALFAQKLKTVEGSYLYRAPENVTVEQAKRTALERAQLDALATAFGTHISQQNSTLIQNGNGKSDVSFIGMSSSDVKGEWIETIGEPKFNVSYEQNMLVVSCQVRGRAREITSAPIDLKVKILCNGTEDKFESDQFRNGDDLYLSFQSPVDGFLAVYLLDEDGNAFCLLPYRNQTDGIQHIKANNPYLFFSAKDAPLAERHIVDEYTMTCERSQETNQICVLFSPNPFVKANDNERGELVPRELDREAFQKWMAKMRRNDSEMVFWKELIAINQ